MSESVNYQERGACLDKDPRVFDDNVEEEDRNTREARLRLARSVCMSCVVREECLEDALQDKKAYAGTIRGGYTTRQRSALAKQNAA